MFATGWAGRQTIVARGQEFQHDKRGVMRALNVVLSSRQFADSTQLSDFLRYIVIKTLDGEEDDIKAYTIAVDALGRSEDFDPQTNAAVRVAAGRLRQALALYNADEDARGSEFRIVLAPGSYIPSFERTDVVNVDEPTEAPDGTSVLHPSEIDSSSAESLAQDEISGSGKTPANKIKTDVLSGSFSISRKFTIVGGSAVLACLVALAGAYFYFAQPSHLDPKMVRQSPSEITPVERPLKPIDVNRRPTIRAVFIAPDMPYPDWFNMGEIVDSIGVSIARFDDYQLLGVTQATSLSQDIQKDSDYLIRVTAYKRQDIVRIFARLTNVKENRVVWSDQWPFVRPQKLNERVIPDLAGKAFSTLGSPYGIIYSDLVRTGAQRKELDCVVAAYKYFNSKSDAQHLKARDCAESLVERGSSLPSIHAALTFLYLDEFREGRNRRQRSPLEAAQKMATRAVEVGPASARAHQAQFAVFKVKGFRDRARSSAEKAIELNPYDTDIVADYAAWLISIGDNEHGRSLMKRVEGLLSARPAWVEFYRFLGAELAGELDEAAKIASLLDIKRSPLVAIAVAIGAHRTGDKVGTRAALDELLRTSPGFATDPLSELERRGFDQIVAKKLIAKLISAGLEVKTAVVE